LKGIYLLIMRLDADLVGLSIGRLGRYDFVAGYYLYVGSALGKGGIAARLAYHEHSIKARPYWHIDYLRPHVALIESWSVATTVHLESCWARQLAAAPEIRIPVPGFGASDSDFTSHLLYSGARPARHLIIEALMDCFLHQQATEFIMELRNY
jgi:Uri superfamily endonuclease